MLNSISILLKSVYFLFEIGTSLLFGSLISFLIKSTINT